MLILQGGVYSFKNRVAHHFFAFFGLHTAKNIMILSPINVYLDSFRPVAIGWRPKDFRWHKIKAITRRPSAFGGLSRLNDTSDKPRCRRDGDRTAPDHQEGDNPPCNPVSQPACTTLVRRILIP